MASNQGHTNVISSRQNDIVRLFRSVKLRHKDRSLIFLEGARLIGDAMQNGIEISAVLQTEKALLKYPELCVENCHTISSDIAEYLSETKTTSGVFAIAKPFETEHELSGSIAYLCGVSDPGNIGTLLRTCNAFGFSAALLDCADIYSQKVIRSSMGAVFTVKVNVFDTKADIIQNIRQNSNVYAAVLSSDSLVLGKDELPTDASIAIGNESFGLDEDVAGACKAKIIIPMESTAESLNAAVAGAILMQKIYSNKK
jgi:rRNA methylases